MLVAINLFVSYFELVNSKNLAFVVDRCFLNLFLSVKKVSFCNWIFVSCMYYHSLMLLLRKENDCFTSWSFISGSIHELLCQFLTA